MRIAIFDGRKDVKNNRLCIVDVGVFGSVNGSCFRHC